MEEKHSYFYNIDRDHNSSQNLIDLNILSFNMDTHAKPLDRTH